MVTDWAATLKLWSGSSPEPLLALVALLLALVSARFRWRWPGWWERPLAHFARSRRRAILIAALAPMLLRVALLPWFPIPEPRVHDEFTFLLGADTLAHARLANPQHPLWPHFESMHLLVRPVYASAFPIGPSIMLAIGQASTGLPWIGVWLSIGLMCGVICWMLQGWVPANWALLGALLAGLRFGVANYWMNSYWGGALAATGGALVIGALPRLIAGARWPVALALGTGLAILANTRPFEGCCFGAAVMAVLVWKAGLRWPILPLALVLALTAAAMGLYFTRITGKPTVMPYVLYRSTMATAPHFLWQSLGPEVRYNNREQRHFYRNLEPNIYAQARLHWLDELWSKAAIYWRFYFGPLLTLPFIVSLLVWRRPRARLLLPIGLAVVFSLAIQVWHYPHYAAAATGLAIVNIMLAMHALRRSGLALAINLVRVVPLACAGMLLLQVTAGEPQGGLDLEAGWRWPSLAGVKRARVLQQLERLPGTHVVLVRYGLYHDPGDEWVYNSADIDGSRVVWARELDRASNQKLLRYYSSRTAWLLEPDADTPRPVPYRDAPQRPHPFVALGAPGIEVLHDPAEVKRKVWTAAESHDPQSCDIWNFYFTQATAVEGPDVSQGCYPRSDRAHSITFDAWFTWLEHQR